MRFCNYGQQILTILYLPEGINRRIKLCGSIQLLRNLLLILGDGQRGLAGLMEQILDSISLLKKEIRCIFSYKYLYYILNYYIIWF